MDCHEIHSRLIAWRDGELGPSEHTAVTQHLGQCPACAAIDQRLHQVTPHRGRPLTVDWSAMEHALADAWDNPTGRPTAPPARSWLPLGVLAAAVALFLLWVMWLPTGAQETIVQEPTIIPKQEYRPAGFSPP